MAVNDWIVTKELLQKSLDYDANTGVFSWKKNRPGLAKAGSTAGTINREGYIQIMLGGKFHAAHRLAWFFVYNEWPDMQVDHINGIPGDNRIANLRLVTPSENSQNKHKARSDNSSGFLGATPHYGKWKSQISIAGVRHYLGRFYTPEEAHAVYLIAKRKLHITCTI